MTRTHQMSNAEVLLTLGKLLEVLQQPDPEADVSRILNSLPRDCATFTQMLGAVAVRAGTITLEVAGVDIEAGTATVELVSFMPPDDVPGFAKTAAELASLGCEFLIASAHDDGPASLALQEASHAAAHRGPEFAFLVLAELLGRIRRLLSGDTREVITS